MAALNCNFAEALCLGIGEYQHDQCLPKAATDAENMASVFRDLGCCNVTFETKEPLTRQRTLKLVSDFVLRTKLQMQEAETKMAEPLLVALFVASHGIHAHGKELPLIVPADLTCSSEIDLLIDLDRLLLNELAQVLPPKQNQRTCCIWIILDTCRSGPVTTWQRHWDYNPINPAAGNRGPRSLNSKLTPFFLFLLACDPGGWASDSDSLSSALVRALRQDNTSIRDACEHAVDAVHKASRGRQRPWVNQRSGTIFSKIRKLSPAQPQRGADEHEAQCLPHWARILLARLAGFATALLVVFVFFGLFFCHIFAGAEKVARGESCPGNSCFCTDCHHRDIYGHVFRDPTQYDYGPRLAWLWPCPESLGPGCWGSCIGMEQPHWTRVLFWFQSSMW